MLEFVFWVVAAGVAIIAGVNVLLDLFDWMGRKTKEKER